MLQQQKAAQLHSVYCTPSAGCCTADADVGDADSDDAGMLVEHNPEQQHRASSSLQKQKAAHKQPSRASDPHSRHSQLSNWQSSSVQSSCSSRPRQGKLLRQLPRLLRQQLRRKMHRGNGSCSMQRTSQSLSQMMTATR